uniref:uncharacterized protein LOC120813993 n=1 Tax=Gasterosteus aculeatus aculeatus TaxID=481459 RepID=UPI001A98490D|nr:uncharacterized protein LOC120813993 [Gasterosteus aculeatus aculeatus]
MFPTSTDPSPNALHVSCEMEADEKRVLFHLHNGVEYKKHERFAGRVQWDKDVLREGRLRLHISRLQTNDSGQYRCEVSSGNERNSKECHLNVTAGSFVVNVTQSSYHAEENHNISLEWMFPTSTDPSPNALQVSCEMLAPERPLVLFNLHEGVEVPEIRDERFAGRVQWDKDVLREGRLRLHISRLQINDSGRYGCLVDTSYGRNYKECHLNVTAANEPDPVTLEPAPTTQVY